MKRRILALSLALVPLFTPGLFSQPSPPAVITSAGLKADVFFLASDELRGRDSLSREGRIAADYIAAEFMRLGFKPVASGTYFQNFPMTAATVDREHTALAAEWSDEHGARSRHFQIGHDFNFVPQSNTPATVTGRVVFAGFGVTAPEYGYDDFAGIDAAGAIVMVLTHEPQEGNEKSRFKGTWNTLHAYNRHKVENIRKHGAAGILLVNEWTPHRPPMTPSAPRPGVQPNYALANEFLDLPVFSVTPETANEILKPAGKTVEPLKSGIDSSGRPASFAVQTRVTMTKALVDSRVVQTRNVAGLLEGSDPQMKAEVIAVTAHYDHLGVSGDRIYHGADDNASGTAGVLEIARAFAHGPRPKRSVLFLVFEAEERGLLGAYQYVMTPVVPLKDTVAVLNMDMIGRDEDSPTWPERGAANANGVNVVGTLYNSDLRKLIEKENAGVGLKLDYKTDADDREGWFSRSDHFPFAEHDVPMVLFNTGEHPDYHTENDTWDRLDYPKMEKIVRLIFMTASELAGGAPRPAFTK